MPSRVMMKTLTETCLLNIAKNMESVWCANYIKTYLDKNQSSVLYVIGPFDVLTPDLIQQLIYLLSEQSLLKTYFLHLLIDSRQMSLDLSRSRTSANKDTIVSLISLRCKILKRLNISTCNQVSTRVLMEIVSLPKLTVLNLKQTKCSDSVLEKIAQSCEHLRELDVSFCPVSDRGIVSLCVSLGERKIKCEKLVKLNVLHTAVTIKGAETILTSLKHIRWLMFADVCEAVYRTVTSHKERNLELPAFPLQYLSIHQMNPSLAPVSTSVNRSVEHCPNVVEVDLERGVSDEALRRLTCLKHIQVLKLANDAEELITFSDGVLPLLQVRGATLQELSLNDINALHFGHIAACCPNIKKFSCFLAHIEDEENTKFSVEVPSVKHKAFSQLIDLTVFLHSPDVTFLEQDLCLLTFCASNLKRLQLNNVSALTDQVFTKIIGHNHLKSLENLNLANCQAFTAEPIWNLLEGENELAELNLSQCLGVTRADFTSFKRLCKDNRFRTNIIWD